MQASALPGSTLDRIRRPLIWGAILAFGVLWNLTRWALGSGGLAVDGELLAPFAWGFFFLALAPLPWQWTGDGRRTASLPRGLAQAIPFNAVCAAALLLLLGAGGAPLPMGPMRMGWGMGHGMGRGMGMMGPGMRGPMDDLVPRRLLILGAAYFCFAMMLGAILAQMERAEHGEDQAMKAAAQARLKALQNQMNPHVLFNAISGVTEMVREDPAGAERALLDLAGLLRYLLDHGGQALQTLGEERILVTRYLALEQLRLGKRLRVEWRWDSGLDDRKLPPLLLQPLVENAIKHGIAPERAGGELRISARSSGADLELEVANTGLPPREGAAESVGLGNLRERLAILGADPIAAFRLRREGPWTLAVLRVPMKGLPDD